MESLEFFVVITMLLALLEGATCTVKYVDGHLTNVIDDCDPSDRLHSCGEGKCCRKERVGYIPEYTGPRPEFAIHCRNLGTEYSICYLGNATQDTMCPCAMGFTCKPALLSTFGHCTKTN